MSLLKLDGAAEGGGFIARSLNTPMSRLEFLQMGGTLLLTMLGIQSFFSVIAKHTNNTSSIPLMTTRSEGFGTRKFGQ